MQQNDGAPANSSSPGYSEQVDSWSLGVLAFMLLSGTPPFKGSNDRAVLDKVRVGKFSLQSEAWESVSKNAKDFVRSLLVYNPANRLTAEAALNHPWLLSAKREAMEEPLSSEVIPSLRRFALLGGWKRAALEAVAFAVPDDDQISHLRAAFQRFDVHSNGYLSWEDFESALGGVGVGSDEAAALFKASALGHEDGVHWSNFLAAVLPQTFLSRDRLRSAFDALDVRREGALTLESFNSVLADDKECLDIAGLFEAHGPRVDFETFFNAFFSNSPKQGGAVAGEGEGRGGVAAAAAAARAARRPSSHSLRHGPPIVRPRRRWGGHF